ncbi:MAG: hypothetical protein WC100_06910 [Sterolibacterium sp.]
MAKDATKKVSVYFTSDAVLQRVGEDDLKYDKGKIYALRPDQAQRWINRGKAILASEAQERAKSVVSDLRANAPVKPAFNSTAAPAQPAPEAKTEASPPSQPTLLESAKAPDKV